MMPPPYGAPPPYPYPYSTYPAQPPPPYGAAYTPAIPRPPPVGCNTQWQWESPRGWVLAASPPHSPQPPLQSEAATAIGAAATEAAGATTTSNGASATTATPVKFVDGAGPAKGSGGGGGSGGGSKVRCSTTTTTMSQEYAHDIDAGFIKTLLEEAAGELRREKRELRDATLSAIRSRRAEARRGAEPRRRQGGGGGGGSSGGGRGDGRRGVTTPTEREHPRRHHHRHGTPPPPSHSCGGRGVGGGGGSRGGDRRRTGERSVSASRSRPSDDEPRRRNRRPSQANDGTPASSPSEGKRGQQPMETEKVPPEQAATAEAAAAEQEPREEQLQPQTQLSEQARGCWCGSAKGIAPGWHARAASPRPSERASARASERASERRRSPPARGGIGNYRSPRPAAATLGSPVAASTPPAPQAIEWDAIYSAINTSSAAEGRGRKDNDARLLC